MVIMAGIHNLRPNEKIRVYHGTRLAHIFDFINGFDANKVVYRHYGGRRHEGLFVSPSVKVADDFAGYSEIILEIETRARNLHGVDYSGYIGRDQSRLKDYDPNQIWKDKFPNSFRPYLSQTLTQNPEPQALLRGLVKPSQIKRIRYKPFKGEPVWYSRREFIELGLEAIPARNEPYGNKRKVQDLGYDMSYPNYSLSEFMKIVEKVTGRDTEMLFKVYINRNPERLMEMLEDIGFGETATKSFMRKMKREWS